MGAMKDLMIDQMNQDWEDMHNNERAYLDAERQYNEEMLWLELQKEEEYIKELEKAKIIVDDTNQEIPETTGGGNRPEHVSPAKIHRPGQGPDTNPRASESVQLDANTDSDRQDSGVTG